MLGATQQQLAERLGLTFQQIQKYERGANRVSASKLYEIAAALRTSVGYFFEGLPNPAESSSEPGSEMLKVAPAPTFEGLQVAELFSQLPNSGTRRSILALMRALAGVE